ncbi:YY1-associated factor 2 isoform X4 [Narcine bancroftii]|uniref:YY1-associated factor 2 isoform X4 n=1 Tax=Narcine bancroftii TaxID=1343680 RepID=UPI0038318414
MGDKKSPTRPKRQPKPSTDEGYWDCSVCTFRNSAEAFKCSMCDVRKGTSTRPSFGRTAKQPGCHRKPRPVSQLVAQQVTQQFASPTQPKKEKKDKGEKEKTEKEVVSKKRSHKKIRRGRSAAHSHFTEEWNLITASLAFGTILVLMLKNGNYRLQRWSKA